MEFLININIGKENIINKKEITPNKFIIKNLKNC